MSQRLTAQRAAEPREMFKLAYLKLGVGLVLVPVSQRLTAQRAAEPREMFKLAYLKLGVGLVLELSSPGSAGNC